MYEGPGIYRHYKGGYYRVLGVARHEGTHHKFVIYHSYSVEHDLDRWMENVDYVARPLNKLDGFNAFNFPVNRAETEEPRFVKVKGMSNPD